MKAVIIIPALNEAQSIHSVLSKIPKKVPGLSKMEILVIDDGSRDDTAKIALENGAIVVRHAINRGLGAAIKTGLTWAKNNSADIAVTMDSDGQHDPNDISKIVQPIIQKKADLVIGSRFTLKENAPLDRVILNTLANIATFLVFGVFSKDSQSGFRAFSKKAISLIDFKSDRMEFSSEILVEASKNNLKIVEVPIKAIYTTYSREKGQKNSNAFPVLMRLMLKFLR